MTTKPNEHHIYWDPNNLYGWVMSQSLPVDSFERLKENEIGKLDVKSIADNPDVGYILEVDLDMWIIVNIIIFSFKH